MNIWKWRKFLPCLYLLLVPACSHSSRVADRDAFEARTELCSIRISAVANSFKTAAHVEIVYTPPDLKEIFVLEPLTDSFEVLRQSPGEPSNRDRAKFGMERLNGEQFRARAHLISRGLPSPAWHSVGDFSQKGVFKVLPGEYRIRIRYSLDGPKKFRYLCFAETDTFEVREGSLWVSTGE